MNIQNLKNLIRLKISALFFDYKNLNNYLQLDFKNINSIVIWKPDGKLGDSQIVSGFIKEIRLHFPNIKMYAICNNSISSIYKNIFKVETIEVEKRPSFFQIREISKKIKEKGGCDLLLSLEASLRPRDIVIANKLKPKFYTAMCSEAKCINIDLRKLFGTIHISEYFVNLLKLGKCFISSFAYIPFESKENEFAKKFIGSKKVIGIAPWGAAKQRRITDEVVINLVKYISLSSDYFIVILVPQEGFSINSKLQNIKSLTNKLIVLPESYSVIQLAGIISNLWGLISVDTANIHIANSYNIPLVGIYSGHDLNNIKQWSPNPKNKESFVFYKKDKYINELSFKELKTSINDFLNFIK